MVRYHRAIETPQDILSSGYRLYVPEESVLSKILLSGPPLLQRLYKEAVLDRGGLINSLDINHKLSLMKQGEQSVMVADDAKRLQLGDSLYFSESRMVYRYLFYAFPKQHWIRASRHTYIMHLK